MSHAGDIPEQFRDKISVDANSGCWVWTGARDDRGYGNVRVGRRVRKAHRVVYESVHGVLVPGLDCDHLCRNQKCVNPAHIEPVPHAENVQRGDGSWMPGERQRTKTHCPRGHIYSPENTYVQPSTGGRLCRTCNREKKRAGGAARTA